MARCGPAGKYGQYRKERAGTRAPRGGSGALAALVLLAGCDGIVTGSQGEDGEILAALRTPDRSYTSQPSASLPLPFAPAAVEVRTPGIALSHRQGSQRAAPRAARMTAAGEGPPSPPALRLLDAAPLPPGGLCADQECAQKAELPLPEAVKSDVVAVIESTVDAHEAATPASSATVQAIADGQASGSGRQAAEPVIVVRAELPPASPLPAAPAGPAALPAGLDWRVDMAQVAAVARDVHVAQLAQEQAAARLAVRQGDRVLGEVGFQVSDGRIAVHVGQVLDLFEDRMEDARFAALRGSQAAQQFVALETIRQAGVPLRYDAVYDELVLGDAPG